MFKQRKKHHRKASRIDTLIGENTHIKGDIHFSGGLRIDGSVTGNIIADSNEPALLTLSEKGRIEGEVQVPYQLINGTIKGNLHASEQVELAVQAHIDGNVFYRLVEITAGATVNGQLIRVDESESLLNIEHEDNHDSDRLHLVRQDKS